MTALVSRWNSYMHATGSLFLLAEQWEYNEDFGWDETGRCDSRETLFCSLPHAYYDVIKMNVPWSFSLRVLEAFLHVPIN